jgi:putative ABC transport system permease protein
MSLRRPLFVDLGSEAVAAILQRPTRLILTSIGVLAGVASVVATLGLAATASAQVSGDFNALLATQVGVAGVTATAAPFPANAEELVDRLPGVIASGTWFVADDNGSVGVSRPSYRADAGNVKVIGASPGYFVADHLGIAGSGISQAHERMRASVADIGIGLARDIGIGRPELPATLLVDGRVVTVIGLITQAPVDPSVLTTVVVPQGAATRMWGNRARATMAMTIATAPGAAQLVAREAPVALDPTNPGALQGVAPPDPTTLRHRVQGSISVLVLGLAAVALVIGGIGIANMTLVSVLERTPEIGLRRAVGARRSHVILQLTVESALTGLLGGLIGACLGLLTVVGVAVAETWTVTMPAGLPIVAPLLGLVVGLVAGAYPAYRAGSIEPVEALRR